MPCHREEHTEYVGVGMRRVSWRCACPFSGNLLIVLFGVLPRHVLSFSGSSSELFVVFCDQHVSLASLAMTIFGSKETGDAESSCWPLGSVRGGKGDTKRRCKTIGHLTH